VPDSVFNPNQTESNLFQMDSNLPQTLTDPKVPSLAPKISNKIWIERASDKEQLFL
jgi:hypothetical protein